MSKICSKCKEEKILEEFHKRKEGKLGRRSECIDCRNKYWATRKDKDDARKKEHRENNREYYREKSKEWYSNKENRKRKLEVAKIWRDNNPEAVKAIYTRSNANRSKEQVRQNNLDRRARLKSIPNTMPKNWWSIMLDFYGEKCMNSNCDKLIDDKNPLTHDHIIPISIEGSTHSLNNSQILCYSCNCSKSNLSAIDYRDWFTGVLNDNLEVMVK